MGQRSISELTSSARWTFTQRLVETAAEAGARDPERLGRQLAVLFEGARALATSCADPTKIDDAREAAEVLVDLAFAPDQPSG